MNPLDQATYRVWNTISCEMPACGMDRGAYLMMRAAALALITLRDRQKAIEAIYRLADELVTSEPAQ